VTQTPIYLDYAATTPLREEVKKRMLEVMDESFGNPSSTHQFGRKSKKIVEECRKFIAKSLHCIPSEIVFTSGGTESDNTALLLAVRDLGVKRIITSPIEHHAILHAAESIQKNYGIALDLLKLMPSGNIDRNHLETLLQEGIPTLVSVMHVNNEIGNIENLQAIGEICHSYKAYFHSDTVQSIGNLDINLSELPIDFISASAHKFYGPKGAGFLFVRSSLKLSSFITGGAQERNMRGGTENTIGLAGMHEALKCKLEAKDEESKHIANIKSHMVKRLKSTLGDKVAFNGHSADAEKSISKILSVCFPKTNNDMLLFNMDLKGIAASGGSACASGSLKGSHVIEALLPGSSYPVLRFSFGKDTTFDEVDKTVEVLASLV
jgi:cysteine desulfurase